jgi:hypothetical protein
MTRNLCLSHVAHDFFQSRKFFYKIPYLRVYKPHIFGKNLPSKIGVRLIHNNMHPLNGTMIIINTYISK